MNKKIFLILLIIVIIACSALFLYKKNQSVIINVTVKDNNNNNNNNNNIEIKVGSILTYSLLGDEYQFKITNIAKDKIIIEVNKYGLTNTSSLISKENKFVIEKGKELKLHTQSTDYQETITFEY